MKILRLIRHTRNDKIKNDDIQGKVRRTVIENKMSKNQLRWFRHIN